MNVWATPISGGRSRSTSRGCDMGASHITLQMLAIRLGSVRRGLGDGEEANQTPLTASVDGVRLELTTENFFVADNACLELTTPGGVKRDLSGLAVARVLERMQVDPRLAYLIGPGSQVWSDLTFAYAAILGVDVAGYRETLGKRLTFQQLPAIEEAC